jgi:hypothetical protein
MKPFVSLLSSRNAALILSTKEYKLNKPAFVVSIAAQYKQL